jgi:exodeoxyribonuclease-1
MAESFFFYDLETSGTNPRESRIMQFAGRRTDLELTPVGEPVNELIQLSPDVLPEPEAILLTGITPQQTIDDGLTEKAFLEKFYNEVVQPGTTFLGYNSIRFDDEFMRFLHWRNFYDAYEWQWKDNCSRWDLLDVVRMTRALRPDGIEWPFAPDGKPTNRLELLTKLNGLDHDNAHDALADVNATIAVAKLIKQTQPKLFEFLRTNRDKKNVAVLASAGSPFVYTSGKYPSEYEKTTLVAKIGDTGKDGALVYDLRHEPREFAKLSVEELVKRWQWTKDEKAPVRLPVKTMKYNRCPAIAPLNVLDDASQKRLKIDMKTVQENFKKLQKIDGWPEKLHQASEILDKQRQTKFLDDGQDVDAQLYDGFLADYDRQTTRAIRGSTPEELAEFSDQLQDERLKNLLPLYKARNFPANLSQEEQEAYEAFRSQKLLAGGKASRLAKYFLHLQELANRANISSEHQYLLEELQLYGQSIMPLEAEE